MNKRAGSVFILFLCCFFVIVAQGQEELPFWRQKPELLKKIKEKRRVVVSVKRGEDGDLEKFRIVGVGAVKAPLSFCRNKMTEFEKLPKISSYFQKVVHKRKEKQIYIIANAHGYQARMLMEYKISKGAGGEDQMDWRVVWGPFKGMVGHFQFQPYSSRLTEVSVWASFSHPKIPIPAFLMKFTLEVIAEKVAQKMRSFIEEEYKSSIQKGA